MGYADREQGIFLFNPMDQSGAVQDMVEWVANQSADSTPPLPPSLSRRLEARLKPSVIDQIPLEPRS